MLLNYICRARILNIYIYGTPSFKKEIHKTLIDSNIKLKLGANNLIKEVESLSALKEIIAENPKEIFLIDDSKIIKKNSFAKKVKFLTPKDGIEEEFLLNSGIADLSVNSLEEIPKYILKKYEQEKAINEINDDNYSLEDDSNITKQDIILDDDNFFVNIEENINQNEESSMDDELAHLLIKNPEEPASEEIDDSIAELQNLFVDNEENITVIENNVDFSDNFGLNNISFDYDDDSTVTDTSTSLDNEDLLKNLISISNDTYEDDFEDNVEQSFDDVNFLDMILNEEMKEDATEDNLQKEEPKEEYIENENLDITKELELDSLLNKIEETKQEKKENIVQEAISIKEEPTKGVKMQNNDFSELDLISEKDLLDALNLEQSVQQNSFEKPIQNSVEVVNNNEVVNISSSNIDELAKLFSKILNNKTLEITIKIKD